MAKREKLVIGVGDDDAEILDLSLESKGWVGLIGADPPVLLELSRGVWQPAGVAPHHRWCLGTRKTHHDRAFGWVYSQAEAPYGRQQGLDQVMRKLQVPAGANSLVDGNVVGISGEMLLYGLEPESADKHVKQASCQY